MKNILLIMCGYPFSGKTVLAKKLSDFFGYERADIDEIIMKHGYRSFDDNNITPQKLSEMYDEYYAIIRKNLKDGRTVISDTSNPSKKGRDRLRLLATEINCKSMVLFLDITSDVARERWTENEYLQERMQIREDTLEEALLEMEKPTKDENAIEYDQSMTVESLHALIENERN